ncbi:UrcA family protein [Acetobacteraceae bacterium KSS8]|uniref:UrcA family protein n=1 Tax=Endosaccharibacter trunci TaxID=2812733 RepID=A0ABT1W7Q1_9PROT|nr:UrcA family protein [Acetobacteraceae bacterium KSS8]
MIRFPRIARATVLATLPAALLLSLQPIAAKADPLSQTVSLSDLDLSTQAGIDAANERLDVAAHRVCADSDVSTLAGRAENEACRAEALSRVRPVMNRLIASARPATENLQLARAGD